MKSSPLTTLFAAVAITGTTAFLIGRFTAPDPSGTATAGTTTLTTKSARPGSSQSASPAADRSPLAAKRGERSSADKTGAPATAVERMQAALRSTDPLERSRAWLAFLDQIAPGEFESVTDAFRAAGVDPSRMGEYAMLLTAWAKTDPVAALEYAKANTGSPFARQTILATWATTDPDSALRWAEQNHEGEGANPWMVGIIRGLAATDPDRATSLMGAMPRSQERGEALDAILPTILERGNQATRDWIAGIGDETLRDGAIMRAAERLAQSDPAGTAAWLAANPGEAANRRLDDVVSLWMQKDKDAAVGYYQNLPRGEARTNALRGLVTSMAVNDPRAAADFLERNSADTNDRVYQQFVWHSFGEAPDLAANYINRITDPDERSGTYRRMLDAWLRRDEAAARQWINGSASQLPADVQQQLSRRIQELDQRQQ